MRVEFSDDPLNNFAIILVIIMVSAAVAWITSMFLEDI